MCWSSRVRESCDIRVCSSTSRIVLCWPSPRTVSSAISLSVPTTRRVFWLSAHCEQCDGSCLNRHISWRVEPLLTCVSDDWDQTETAFRLDQDIQSNRSSDMIISREFNMTRYHSIKTTQFRVMSCKIDEVRCEQDLWRDNVITQDHRKMHLRCAVTCVPKDDTLFYGRHHSFEKINACEWRSVRFFFLTKMFLYFTWK